MNQSLLSQD